MFTVSREGTAGTEAGVLGLDERKYNAETITIKSTNNTDTITIAVFLFNTAPL
jgi:hypothetical protein